MSTTEDRNPEAGAVQPDNPRRIVSHFMLAEDPIEEAQRVLDRLWTAFGWGFQVTSFDPRDGVVTARLVGTIDGEVDPDIEPLTVVVVVSREGTAVGIRNNGFVPVSLRCRR